MTGLVVQTKMEWSWGRPVCSFFSGTSWISICGTPITNHMEWDWYLHTINNYNVIYRCNAINSCLPLLLEPTEGGLPLKQIPFCVTEISALYVTITSLSLMVKSHKKKNWRQEKKENISTLNEINIHTLGSSTPLDNCCLSDCLFFFCPSPPRIYCDFQFAALLFFFPNSYTLPSKALKCGF